MKKNILFIFLLLLLMSVLFIPGVTYASTTADNIYFIKNEDGSGDAIVIESNGHFGLVDTMGPSANSTLGIANNSLARVHDNGTKVYNYLKDLGCEYLDFIVITHNDSDHSGGISELNELVDSRTVVFYKDDVLVDGDYDESLGKNNHSVYLEQMSYLNLKGAMKCNVSSCIPSSLETSFITELNRDNNEYENNLEKNISYKFGDFGIKLYNLYTLSNHNENLNSIVTLITKNTQSGVKKVVLMGDLESGRGDVDYSYASTASNIISNPTGTCDECTTLGIENQMAEIIGKVDVVKAGNHGEDTSNSYYMFSKFEPHDYIITDTYVEENGEISPKESSVAAVKILKEGNITETSDSANSYYTQQSSGAIAIKFDLSGYNIKDYDSNGNELNTSIDPIGDYIADFNTVWFSMNDTTNKNKKWVYIINSDLTTGWMTIDGDIYYFDVSGKMITGFEKIEIAQNVNAYYYFTEESIADVNHKTGTLRTGLTKAANGDIFFLNETGEVGVDFGRATPGVMVINGETYHFRENGSDMSDGTIYSAIKGLAVADNDAGYYYFRATNNDVSTGSEGTMVTNECVRLGNKKYCFGNDGLSTSVITYAEAPRNTSCINPRYNGLQQELTYEALEGYTWSNNFATSVGEYQVSAVLEEGYTWDDGNDGTDPIILTCRIDKRRIAKPTIPVDEIDYKGTTITPTIVGFDDDLMTKTGKEEEVEVGNYSITVSLRDTIINEWEDGTTSSVILNWRIYKGHLDPPSIVNYSGIYDGNSHTISVEPIIAGTLAYSTDNINWSDTLPTRTEVGTTTVYVKIIGDNNYNDSGVATGTITINKSPAKTPVVSDYAGLVNGYPHTITVEQPDDGTLVYRTDNTDWSTTKPTQTDFGDLEIYVKVVGDSNHTDSEVVSAHVSLVTAMVFGVSRYGVDWSNNYIYKIDANTTVDTFKHYIQISDGFTLDVDAVSYGGKNVIYTGGKTQLIYGSVVFNEYTNIVSGDTNGDGKINYLDYVNVYNHIQKVKHPELNKQLLEGIYYVAGDMSNDSNINYLDYVGIYNKIKELKGGNN